MQNNDRELRVLVMAPVGQDARAIAELLIGRGFPTRICNGAAECCAEINAGAGAVLLTEEALETERGRDVLGALKMQPQWSELPLIILTTGGEPRLNRLLELAAEAAGTVTLLERPISSITLLRSVEVALRSRRRQFQVRDLLEEQHRAQRELRDAHDQLADRARQLEALVQERTAKLVQTNEQLRSEMSERERAEAAREALRRELLNAQEEERRRIARELHDQMGQNLTALNLGLKSLHDSDPSATNFRWCGLFRSSPPRLREISIASLWNCVRQHSTTSASSKPFALWSKPGPTIAASKPISRRKQYDPAGVSSEIETTLYRIIQEALNNVAKHSGASRISLVLRRTADQAQAIIEDNGRGFETTRALERPDGHGRLGLVGIQERLAGMNGSLHLESAPGQGATLIVRVPIIKST